jgi:hypothetical protein
VVNHEFHAEQEKYWHDSLENASSYTSVASPSKNTWPSKNHMTADIDRAARMDDITRYLGHMPKLELVVGDVEDTLPSYLDANPHLCRLSAPPQCGHLRRDTVRPGLLVQGCPAARSSSSMSCVVSFSPMRALPR